MKNNILLSLILLNTLLFSTFSHADTGEAQCRLFSLGQKTNVITEDVPLEESRIYGFTTPVKKLSYVLRQEISQTPWIGLEASVKTKIVILKDGIQIFNQDRSGKFRDELKGTSPGNKISIIVGHYEGDKLVPNTLRIVDEPMYGDKGYCTTSLYLGSDDGLGDDRVSDFTDGYLLIGMSIWLSGVNL